MNTGRAGFQPAQILKILIVHIANIIWGQAGSLPSQCSHIVLPVFIPLFIPPCRLDVSRINRISAVRS